jgi:hypothetical protein
MNINNSKKKLIGISYRTFKDGSKNKFFFDPIYKNLKKRKEFKILWVDILKFDFYKKYNFDFLITFSSYNEKNSIKCRTREYRYLTTKLNYKSLLYIESPICHDLLPSKFRINLNSIYFCENQLKDYISKINYNLIKKTQFKINNIPQNRQHILLLLQNPEQYFIEKNFDEYKLYLIDIIEEVRKKTNKKIIIRYKPQKNYNFDIDIDKYNCIISDKSLIEDCQRSYKCIAHSTNAVSFCVFMEMDIIALSKHNLAYEICEKDFENVDNYLNYDYTDLKTKILASAWSSKDLESNLFIKIFNTE